MIPPQKLIMEHPYLVISITLIAGASVIVYSRIVLSERKRLKVRDTPPDDKPQDRMNEETLARDMMASLSSQRDRLIERRDAHQKIFYVLIGFSTLVMSAVLADRSTLNIGSLLLSVPLVLLFLTMLAMSRNQLHSIEEALQDVNFEIDLQRYKSTTRESKAEKMLRINSTQLRRYYDLNLQQNKWMFLLGIVCILVGVGLIGTSLYLVVSKLPDTNDKIIAAVLGGVGAFLTNFIAAMYLKMNSTAAENLAAFHTQLVKTQELVITNLLAAGIDNDEKRWTALTDLSLSIVGRPTARKD